MTAFIVLGRNASMDVVQNPGARRMNQNPRIATPTTANNAATPPIIFKIRIGA
jgi:hypothetical protein